MSAQTVRFNVHLKHRQTGEKLKFADIVARDKTRARLYVDNLRAGHGPKGVEAHKRRHHHHGHHSSNTDASTGGDAQAPISNAPTARDPSTGQPISVGVTDAAVTYTANVGVGSPATDYTLLIDTGSSNTWVGAGKKYVKTKTSKSTGDSVSVSYGSGSFSGTEFTDTVTVGPGLVITNQSIGVSSRDQGFDDVDGIIGIGPVDLTEGTVSNTSSVPTVTDNLFSQGTIPSNSLGISYEPSSTSGVENGELTFGGTDNTKFENQITFTPISKTSPASEFWGIDQTVAYGNKTILSTTSGIVDTGTTLLLLATEAFDAYQKATGATLDNTTGLLTLPASDFEKLQDLNFSIGGTTFTLTPDAQVWPVALNEELGGEAGKIYLVTSDLGSSIGQGLDFIDGFVFLQRFYSVFDTTNAQVGLANTEFTTEVINNPQ
ncbi:acid protease [Schizopora paradoxa]|uniref:Acid protease n=1 Tax=Schizopora paradoxa TaxID=27342 RepID=A0A0H2RZ38_9AGAM|nr:acid protease [Schizopora paradoxa]